MRLSPILRYCLLALVVVDVAVAALTLVDWSLLLGMLAGRSLLERGWIASDDVANFVALSGKTDNRRALSEARARNLRAISPVPRMWVWAAEQRARLDPDARIYLDGPNVLLYYYATFFWFPRPVEVACRTCVVKDPETLRRAVTPTDGTADITALRGRGYTHLLHYTAGGPQLVDLRIAHEGGEP